MHSLAHGNTNYSETRNVTYAYDLMNRLTNVDDANIDSFDEVFTYDPQGRIKSQRRAASVTNTAGGEYDYYANTNKLKKVSAGMSSAVDSARIMNADSNFVYDADGNMIYDASKKMAVSYDYRGLPTAFAKQELSGDSVRLLMTYDGAGNRISKRYERKAAAETVWTLQLATHYTGLGSEIRESGLDNTAKVVVNLPQGLGRYGVENAVTASATTPGFEWYLKNHLGSTLLVYGTGASQGVKAAYDYRAFGEQVSMVNPSDKVTENFTGKELDDETDLGYFGARYLDQMLGMWVSMDPKRQFASPYLYAGNGVNPIRFFDPDGNEIVMDPRNSQEYNAKVDAAISAISQSSQRDLDFIKKLQNSESKVVIKQSMGNNNTKPTILGSLKNLFGLGGDAEVHWNSEKRFGGLDENGSHDRDPFIGLAHELGHVEDVFDGKFTTSDIRVGEKGIPLKEMNSIDRENQIREDTGNPLREEY